MEQKCLFACIQVDSNHLVVNAFALNASELIKIVCPTPLHLFHEGVQYSYTFNFGCVFPQFGKTMCFLLTPTAVSIIFCVLCLTELCDAFNMTEN